MLASEAWCQWWPSEGASWPRILNSKYWVINSQNKLKTTVMIMLAHCDCTGLHCTLNVAFKDVAVSWWWHTGLGRNNKRPVNKLTANVRYLATAEQTASLINLNIQRCMCLYIYMQSHFINVSYYIRVNTLFFTSQTNKLAHCCLPATKRPRRCNALTWVSNVSYLSPVSWLAVMQPWTIDSHVLYKKTSRLLVYFVLT